MCACGAILHTNRPTKPRAPATAPSAPVVRVLDDGHDLRYSFHANERRCQMNIRHSEVRAALSDPELTYPAKRDEAPGGMCYQAGRIVVITSADGQIITLLWHGAEGRDEHGQPLRAT